MLVANVQVSYANIQGKASLITKFRCACRLETLLTVRNSHVMDALEEWRPQIFYSDGALKGQPVSDLCRMWTDNQEPFPEADHPARHQQRGSFSRAPFVTGAPGSNGGSISAAHNPYRQAAA